MDRFLTPLGLDLIKRYEDFRPKPYDDGTGTITIGYGHTRTKIMPASITEEGATELLVEDLDYFEGIVQREVRVPVNRNQYAALVSLVFNIGEGAFRNSTLLKKLNNGNYQAAANEFEKWTKAGQQELKGLVRRREAEKQLFITPPIPDDIRSEVMSIPELMSKLFVDPEAVQKAKLQLNPAYYNGLAIITRPVFDHWTQEEDDGSEMAEDTGDAGPVGNGDGQPTGPVPVP
jgi:lysozyme